MLFTTKSTNPLIIESVNAANFIKADLLKHLRENKKEFLSANIDSVKLAELIENDDSVMDVHTYYYWRSNVLGKFNPAYPNRIYVNTNSLPRSIASLVATIHHESIHYLDSKQTDFFFHHGNNRYAKWKEDTAPYYVGGIAYKIAKGEPLEYDPTEPNDIVTVRRRRWYFLWLK
jgi:hypothetical protein